MRCPQCGHTYHQINDVRPSGNDMRRRRQCHQCGHKWSTLEVMDGEVDSLRKLRKAVDGLLQMLAQMDGEQ